MAKVQIIDRPDRWDEPFSHVRLPAETVAGILALPLFRVLNRQDFPDELMPEDIIANDCRINSYGQGDVIYEAGSYQTSLFIVAAGAVRMQPQPSGQHPGKKKSPSRNESWFRKPLYRARRRLEEFEWKKNVTRPPADVLVQNDLFGEIEAFTRTARRATAIADAKDTVVLEIRWPGARELLHWSDAFRAHVTGLYRTRSIELGLRQCSLFADDDDDLIRAIAKQCFFDTHGSFGWTHAYQRERAEQSDRTSMAAHEPVIVEQGQYLEDLFLIHSGFARLTEETHNGERTIGFLKAGELYGASEFDQSLRNGGAAIASYGLRAVGYADIIRIPIHFVENPVLPSDGAATANGGSISARESFLHQPLLDFVVDNRLINGTKAMVIDTTRCVNCDDCIRACAATHDSVARFERQGITHGKFMVVNACMHCADPVCLIDCPTDAISRDSETGNVVIEEKTCIGCASCENACPYNNIRMIDALNSAGQMLVDKDGSHVRTAAKCDLCTGQSGGPACVRACPHDAMKRIDLREAQTLSDWL